MTFSAELRSRQIEMPFGVEASPFVVREESRADFGAREALLDAAMGEARFARTSERLRAGRQPAKGLALTATLNGKVVGTIRLWSIDAGGAPALLLGPLAVSSEYRGCGIGGALMHAALRRAKARGHAAVLLVGDAPYYARFGFDNSLTANLLLPGPVDRNRFLALELEPGSLLQASGMVRAVEAGPRMEALMAA